MKILAPVNSPKEAQVLISHGAGELYCGVHPAAWTRRHGKKVWLNRRGAGNVGSLTELKELTGIAHNQGVTVCLTLNLPFYPPQHYDDMVEMAQQATVECAVDALIIADPGLILAVKNANSKVNVHVSSLAAVLNSQSVKFFESLGVNRVIFPRYNGLANLSEVISQNKKMEYEVFILNDGCMFEEGYCHANHTFGGAFCSSPRSYRLGRNGQAKKYSEPFKRHLADYQRWIWYVGTNCGGTSTREGFPNGMCGICALAQLRDLGIVSLKIIGREAPLAKKVASVKLVRQVLDLVESGAGPEEVANCSRTLRGSPQLCDSGYMCYFR